MMITIRTAQQQEVIDLQNGSRYRAPMTRLEAEEVVADKTFNHTHVATCEGVAPIYAKVAGDTMEVWQACGGDGWREKIEISGDRDAINKLSEIAVDNAKAVLGSL